MARRSLEFERFEFRSLLASNVVINEIHYDPDIKTEQVEFVELHNLGATAADLSGWSFADGISYTFADGVSIPPNGFVVVAQDPVALGQKFSVSALGPYSGKLSNEGEHVELVNARGDVQDEVSYQLGFPWPIVGDAPGNSIELINVQLDNGLGGAWRSSVSGPTPHARNSRVIDLVPPMLAQVEHQPQQPTTGNSVTVSARVTDDDGLSQVELQYQVVSPGDYISIVDPRYTNTWTIIPMHDDGQAPDLIANDNLYTAVLPANLQQHRHLVRYRIVAADARGASVTAPYEDDPVPNFAYYVYDGTPTWQAAPGPNQPSVSFDRNLLDSVQPYQLLTTRADHVNSQQLPGASESAYPGREYRWHGTMIAGGKVYDHIRFRARGGENRFERGKNAWKFDFNRGQQFTPLDNYGAAYQTKWDKLNLDHIANVAVRGEHSMHEALSYRLFNLAGVEAPRTHFVHFRIVENAEETSPDQYQTDFQGLYLAAEQPDGNFLDEHELPDGNLYKIEQGVDVPGTRNNQGPFQPTDSSDLVQFVDSYSGRGERVDEQWWRDNLDVERYFSYRSIVEAVRHYDITGTNQYYFHNPDNDKWSVHPWDLDLSWSFAFGSGGDAIAPRILRHDTLEVEYHNRLREIITLLFNHDQTDMLIDETAQFIYTPGQLSFVDADRAMWDNNPIIAASSSGGTGQFYASSPTGDFAGMLQVIRQFIDTRTDFINRRILKDDSQIPDTPILDYIGDDDFALNRLTFRASEYNSQSGQPFAAMQWRIAEVTDPDSPTFDPHVPRKYEINANWDSGRISAFDSTLTIPGERLSPGQTYRVRVRMQDAVGYWSRWSEPVQFVASPGKGALIEGLRVVEINYHPEPYGRFDDEEFEFVELQNVSQETIDLAGVSFEDAIRLTLPVGAGTLLPNERILIVANREAFESRYGATQRIAGEYDGRLNNAGERVLIKTSADEIIQDFTYDDENGWPVEADGGGPTLEVVDPHGDYNNPNNWRTSRLPGGSPGRMSRMAGDVNSDAVFSSADLIAALQAGEYEDSIAGNSTFEEGDWNGDGEFNSLDIVFAFQWETFQDVVFIASEQLPG